MKQTFRKTFLLFSNILLLNIKRWQHIFIILLPLLVMIISNSILVVLINNFNDFNEFLVLKNIFIILNSLFLIIFSLFLYVHLFIIHWNNGYYKTELRFGYKLGEIFFSRIFYIYTISLIVFILNLLVSVLFYVSMNDNDITFIYNVYISQMGWYAIIMFLFPIVGLIITAFFKNVTSIIMTTITSIFLVIMPTLTIFLNLVFEHKDSWPQWSTYKNTISINIRNSIKEDFEKNEISSKIYTELESLLPLWFLMPNPEIYYGPNYWQQNNGISEEQIPTYTKFLNEVENILGNKEIFKWSDHKEFNLSSGFGQEKPQKIIDKLEENISEEFLPTIQIYKKYLHNWNIIKVIINENDILFNLIGINNNEEIIKTEFKDQPTYFMFVKTFNFLTFSSLNEQEFNYGIIEAESPFKKIKNKEKYLLWSNLINPIHHFNLMYNSTNYTKNSFYYDGILAAQPFYNKVINLKIDTNLTNESLDGLPKVTIKTLIPVEIIYIFYFLVGNLIIWFNYLAWKKRIKL